jgi:hypothetical protein
MHCFARRKLLTGAKGRIPIAETAATTSPVRVFGLLAAVQAASSESLMEGDEVDWRTN